MAKTWEKSLNDILYHRICVWKLELYIPKFQWLLTILRLINSVVKPPSFRKKVSGWGTDIYTPLQSFSTEITYPLYDKYSQI